MHTNTIVITATPCAPCFCTQAYLNGVPELFIMRQSRHQSLDTVREYIRDRSLFRDNPAAKLGL